MQMRTFINHGCRIASSMNRNEMAANPNSCIRFRPKTSQWEITKRYPGKAINCRINEDTASPLGDSMPPMAPDRKRNATSCDAIGERG